jgi:diguanylate cyclase (GGDEF)-like protein
LRFEIDPDKCVSCLACVRVCAARAISVGEESVRIDDEACIRSGSCLPECPHDAIRAVGDLARAEELARTGAAVLILAVEAAAHFYPNTPEQVVNACYKAGFRAVHHGVLGDELVAEEYRKLLADPNWSTMIRSTCPVVVARIQLEYPELVPFLAPVQTPLGAEAEYHRALYGENVGLVYAGVCLAETSPHVDAVVTLSELGQLLERRGVNLAGQLHHYERIPEVRQRFLSTAGGLPLPVLEEERQASRRFRKMRGLGSLAALAHAVALERIELGFVDILACEGCLDHPLMGPKEELFWRRRVVTETEPPRSHAPVVEPGVRVRLDRAFDFYHNGRKPPQIEIDRIVETIGHAPGGAPWDCGACGYDTCAAFAVAMLEGRSTLRQCPPYQERRAEDAIRVAAVDELTGLATFRMLRARLEQEVARSDRSGEPFGVLFVDMDDFKKLNDAHGHEAGNRVLEGVGRELEFSVRKTDLAARYGGDEFVLVLVRTDLEGAVRVGEMVREGVEAFGRAQGFGGGEVSVSVGVACHDPRAAKVVDVLREADQALYMAKERGGNQVAARERGAERESTDTVREQA